MEPVVTFPISGSDSGLGLGFLRKFGADLRGLLFTDISFLRFRAVYQNMSDQVETITIGAKIFRTMVCAISPTTLDLFDRQKTVGASSVDSLTARTDPLLYAWPA
jgi:hypothetical protein